MLAAWTEILPLFIVRWLACELCERISVERDGNTYWLARARRDTFFHIKM